VKDENIINIAITRQPSFAVLEPVWLGVCGSVFIETVAIYCLVTKRAATFMYGSHL
jgi:F0F1-type ATP synthase membrane subunit c/vacuolar-type H+-ATPase subunit K